MTRIAYVSNDDGLAALLQAARLAPDRLTEDEARTLVRTSESPVVLVLDGRQQPRLVHWAQGFLGGKPTVAVLLLVKALDYTSVPDAMQAGVRDCLPEPLAAAALDRAVRRLVDLVEAAAATASTLRQRFGSRRLRVVINRYDKNATVSAQDVAMVIGEPVAWTVPNDYRAAVEAINTGRPFTLQDGRLSKAMRQVAAELTHTTRSSTGTIGSMLGRLSWRRV